MTGLVFRGWWERAEKKETPAWETFKIMLNGIEAGDFVDSPRDVRRILKLSGYKLKLERISK